MTTFPRAPWRANARRTSRLLLLGLAVVVAAIIGTLGHQPVASLAPAFGNGSPSAPPFVAEIPASAASGSIPTSPSSRGGGHTRAAAPGADVGRPGQPGRPSDLLGQATRAPLPGRQLGALGKADGLIPNGASVFDDDIPAVANLDPSLLEAFRRAAADAAKDGVEFRVNSGWRSAAYQEELLREAVAEYGSEKEAARWVATPDRSAHVSGDAVDIGPSDAAAWLSGHGARYGLCQTYGNEPWHFELRPDAINAGCPAMYADSSHGPRTQP